MDYVVSLKPLTRLVMAYVVMAYIVGAQYSHGLCSFLEALDSLACGCRANGVDELRVTY